jgi:hypothetical protein
VLTSDRILVLDGHDGCGKSTLSAGVASILRGAVVKPFADTLGDHIAWLWGDNRFDEADALARSSIERILERKSGLLVFDRHWATMFTVLPQRFWSNWGELPRTVICHASLETVVRRLSERGEDIGDPSIHSYYLQRYLDVADQCPRRLIVDTSEQGVDSCVSRIATFLRQAR